ncbi:MAG: DUF1905 domain-containing protein [Caldilineaceae bacterium]|nr:DUF1905 domain-containing protein [Caldilineaceae bacterium]
MMSLEFSGEIIYWRGPAPWFFVAIPDEESGQIKSISDLVSYGWGCIPVHVRIGKTRFQTSLFPKDERYLVPVKAAVRKAMQLEEGDTVSVLIEIDLS